LHQAGAEEGGDGMPGAEGEFQPAQSASVVAPGSRGS